MNRPALALAVLLLGAPALAVQPSSISYYLKQSTLNGGGSDTTSPSTSYRVKASMGQESTIGASSSTNYIVQSGFWSYLGSGPVPIFLTLGKNDGTDGNPDLGWSGNAEPYEIYRNEDCSQVDQPSSFLASTNSNDYTDEDHEDEPFLCYRVYTLGTGPSTGSSPEPQ